MNEKFIINEAFTKHPNVENKKGKITFSLFHSAMSVTGVQNNVFISCENGTMMKWNDNRNENMKQEKTSLFS
jgi:hypothetical protein